MLAIVRRQQIVDIIKENKKVLVQDLAFKFKVTEETIRRDLEKLEEQSILKRTYGGAVLNEGTDVEMHVNIREVMNKEGKSKIANAIVEEIHDGDTIMLDSSSTAFYVAKSLKEKNKRITIITNALKVILELQNNKNIKIISSGGVYRDYTKSFIGKFSEDSIKNYFVNKTIFCCKGLDLKRGVMDSNEEEAQIKNCMIKSSNEVFLLVDFEKFDKSSFVKITDFNKIDYVYTDKAVSTTWKKFFEDNNIKLKICE